MSKSVEGSVGRSAVSGRSAETTRVGEKIGSIRIVELLGAGGMGEVYVGFDETLQRRVALKAIAGRHRLSPTSRARFLREARILSQLEHPGICRIYDYIEEGQAEYLVLELIQGQDLAEVIAAGSLTPQHTLQIARDIAAVLAAAHGEGIVHRDLKPGNVMLTTEGEVKVLDFGLARSLPASAAAGDRGAAPERSPRPSHEKSLAADDATLTIAADAEPTLLATPGFSSEAVPLQTELGSVLGTPQFMSPEQAKGEPATTASDMYSFGLLLQTLYSGRLPFEPGLELDELLRRAARAETLPVSGVGGDLAALITRLKSPAPAARPTALAVVERLDWIRDKPKRRARRLLAAGILLVLALGGLKYTLDLRRERNLADQRRGQAEDLIGFMLGDLRAKLQPVGRLEILDDVGEKAMEYFAAVDEAELSDEELLSRSRALYQIGEVRIGQGSLDGAVRPLEESLALARSLAARNPADGERLFELGQSHFWVGFVHWRRGDLEAALEQFEDYLEVSERLVAMDPGNRDWRLELGYAHSNIGSVLQARGDLEGALERFRATLEIKRGLAAEAPDDAGLQLDLARTYNTVGLVAEQSGDLQAALQNYEAELAAKQALARLDPGNAGWQYELAISHNYSGHLLGALGDLEGRLRHHRSAAEGLASLVEQDPANSTWRRELAVTLYLRGQALARAGAAAAATEDLERSVEMLRALVVQDPTDSGWQYDLARSQTDLGAALASRGQLAAAHSAGQAARGILEAYVVRRPEDVPAHVSLSSAYLLLGNVAARQGDYEPAAGWWKQAAELLQPFGAETSDWRVLYPWVQALLRMDRVEEARPVMDKLDSFGFRQPDYEKLKRSLRRG